MSGPEGYYETADCRAQKFYVCQNNADFSLPPQGKDEYLVLLDISVSLFIIYPFLVFRNLHLLSRLPKLLSE